MDRIHHPSAIATPPSVDAHATPGYPTEGNPIGGIEATVMTAWIGHSLIEEQRAVIVAAGITPDKATLTQLRQAIAVLIGKSMQVFGTSGSFTVPVGVYRIRCRVWGGGGGGGGAGAGGGGASGGAGGGYAEGWYDVTPGQSLAVTIGAGGAAGNGTPANGGTGGTSSVGSLLSATGGNGGNSATGGGTGSTVAGGVGTGGALNIPGNPANGGVVLGGTALGSSGGGTFCTSLVGGYSNANGNSPGFPGGGGGGAGGATNQNGAAGAAGYVIIEW